MLPGDADLAALSWGFPLALWLLPLPLIMLLLEPYREQREAVRVPFFERLVRASGSTRRRGATVRSRQTSQTLLVLWFWCCLVMAAAKPQWLADPIEQQRAGRDLMVAVDLSGSMETADFTDTQGQAIDRLAAVKTVLRRLVDERREDRLGLIVFGSGAYLQAPFTEDHAPWLTLLNETRIRMAGPSTVLGDAVGLAIKLFRETENDQRVLVILTDGNDTDSLVPPIDAARVAAADGIRIYPIAIGDPASVGEEAIDWATLERIAEISGGKAFRALDRDELDAVFRLLSELEPSVYASVFFRPRIDLFALPIALALLAYLGFRLPGALRQLGRGAA